MRLDRAFKKFNKLLFNYAFLRIGDRQLAEDIVQETFMKAHRSRDTFDAKKSSLKNWLFRIEINTIYDFLKNKGNIIPLEDDLSEDVSLSAEVSKNDLINFVFEKIKALSDRDQELLILRYQSDLKIKEIAELFDMEKGAVKVAIHRALKKLKKLC